MRDFLDDLERRLAVMAEEHPDLQPAPAPAKQPIRRGRRGRRPFALGGLAALIATIAAAFTMSGTSLAELPILGTPTEDASYLREQAKDAAKAGVDFKRAHVFGTPGGPGFALVNQKTQTLCLVVPDPLTPGQYGGSCGAPIAKIEREGLQSEMVGDQARDPDATVLWVFVLPEGAEDVKLGPHDPRTTFRVQSGVAVVEAPAETSLSWTVDGVRESKVIEGPFAASAEFGVQCPDGSTRSFTANITGKSLDETNQIMQDGRKKALEACK